METKSAVRCAEEVDRLTRWIEILVAEGHATYSPQYDLEPVPVTGIAPGAVPLAPAVTVTRDAVTYQGTLVATHAEMRPDAIEAHLERTRALMVQDGVADLDLAVIADARSPWSSIAAIGRAATAVGFARMRFVFRGASRLSDPEPSWLDAQAGPLRHVEVADPPTPDLEAALRRAKDPTRRRVFDRCASGRRVFDELDARAGETGDRAALIAAGVPGAFRACGCAEELGAVQRMMWDLWSRFLSNMPHAAVVVGLSADGPRLGLAGATPWSEAHALVVERARSGEAFAF